MSLTSLSPVRPWMVLVPLALVGQLACSLAGDSEVDGPATDKATPASADGPSAVHRSWSLQDTPLDRTAAQLSASTTDHLARARKLHERIVSVQGEHTVENTLVPLNLLSLHLDSSSMENDLFANVHPYDAVREAADAGAQELSSFNTELSLDRRLYEAVKAVDLSTADEATRFAVMKQLRNYRRAGVDQSEEVRARITQLNAELTKLSQDFTNNIAEGTRQITLDSIDQLAGLPADYVAAHQPGEDGKIVIDTTYPDYQPFITYAEDTAAREALYLEYQNRAYPQNMDVLDAILEKRDEKAQLLGYGNWAAYITEDKMIGSAENAAAFIDRIAEVSRGSARRDYQRLLRRKQQDLPDATSVTDYEKAFYSNLVKQDEFDFDPQAVRPYFNYPQVQQGVFDVMTRLFGVTFRQVEGLDLWHEDVSAWDLIDDGKVLGRFYLDMHPRKDKFQHAACFPYRPGVTGLCLPQATLVCNFPNPRTSPDGVALMEFAQVSTFFHEFGHLMHHLFAGTSRWVINAGISNEWDFVEAPSQMLEEFLYEPELLQSFAKHHETGEPIPAELIAKLRAAADFGKGLNTAHQMFYAALSLGCYTEDPAELDTNELVRELQSQYSPFAYVDGAHFQCAFGHLDGYSAIYYTYMWSQVIAKDMFSRFEADGVLDAETAAAYRRFVLEPGSREPAAVLVQEFLGRPYDFTAFQLWLDRG